MKNAQVTGMGHYVPENIITNHDLEKMMDTSDEWIRERTGIVERRWVTPGEETINGMGYKASLMALEQAGMTPEDIDFIVFASIVSDMGFPGGGCLMQEKLGIPGVPCMDIRNACSGFMYALAVGDKFIKTGTYKTVLVVGSEIQSLGIDKSTRGRDISVIFADGAGAVILSATDNPHKGILTTHLHADGRYARKLYCEWPSIHHTPGQNPVYDDPEHNFPHMEGRFVFKHAVVRFPEVIMEALQATGYTPADLDLFIPHQANQRITEAVAARLEIPMEKVMNTIVHYGNTTAATIPMAMSMAKQEGKIRDGSLVCLAAFGSGFTWGSALIRF